MREIATEVTDIACLSFSDTAGYLGAGTSEGAVLVFSTNDGSLLAQMASVGNQINCLAFSRDGRYLASTGEELLASKDNYLGVGNGNDFAEYNPTTIAVWGLSTGERVATLSGHRQDITSLDFSVNGERLLSSSADGTTRIWDVQTGCEVLSLSKGGIARFGKQEKEVRVFDRQGGVTIFDSAPRSE